MNKILFMFSTITGLIVFPYSGSIIADEFNDAIRAMQNENYQYSNIVWNRLSQQGDVIAEFNMALNLKRMNIRTEEQNSWLRTAARERLVTAYSLLQPDSIKPDQPPSPVLLINTAPDDWVRVQNAGYYTLQLASSTYKQSIEKIYQIYNLKGQGSYFKNIHQGETRYTLVYGNYRTALQARNAIGELPAGLRKWKPWVRKVSSIHKIMVPF